MKYKDCKIESKKSIRSIRLSRGILNLNETIIALEYIGNVDQPERKYGGFHDKTILAARSALYHIRNSKNWKQE
jgi:hypothetical protein